MSGKQLALPNDRDYEDIFELAADNPDWIESFTTNDTISEELQAIARVITAHAHNEPIDPDDWDQAGLPTEERPQ